LEGTKSFKSEAIDSYPKGKSTSATNVRRCAELTVDVTLKTQNYVKKTRELLQLRNTGKKNEYDTLQSNCADTLKSF